MHQLQVIQLVDGGFAAKDIHGLPRDEMLQPPLDLGRAALDVGTEPLGFSFFPDEGRAAVRTDGRELRQGGAGSPFGGFHTRNLGNDLSALFHIDPVSFMDVQRADLVFVHQGGAPHHGAAQQHGFLVGHRRDRARPAHLIVDGKDGRKGLLRLEFVGYGPAGTLGRIAQFLLEGEFVDFDIEEALNMTKEIPEYQYKISKVL